MKIVDLGLIDYFEAEELQKKTLTEVRQGGESVLYTLEHPKVITYGKNGGAENLHVSEDYLEQMGIALAQTARGGNVTCHFPGQLVAYPIFRIDRRKGGIRAFFHDMEETVIRTLDEFGVKAGRIQGRPGVWVGEMKICSMGIGVKSWVTYHGLALNVGSDLSLFQLITLCGLTGAEPTSISLETGEEVGVGEVKNVLTRKFQDLFAHSQVA